MRASCHCGAVAIEVPAAPDYLNECGCSICRRYAVRWAYYRPDAVRVVGGTAVYVREGGELEFHRCGRCGCVTHWRTPDASFERMGVNARLMEPAELEGVPVKVTAGPPD